MDKKCYLSTKGFSVSSSLAVEEPNFLQHLTRYRRKLLIISVIVRRERERRNYRSETEKEGSLTQCSFVGILLFFCSCFIHVVIMHDKVKVRNSLK